MRASAFSPNSTAVSTLGACDRLYKGGKIDLNKRGAPDVRKAFCSWNADCDGNDILPRDNGTASALGSAGKSGCEI